MKRRGIQGSGGGFGLTALFSRRNNTSLALSVVLHVLLFVALANVVFRYPLGQMMGIRKANPETERLRYVALPAQPTEHSGSAAASDAASAPAALRAPRSVPTVIPPVAADTSSAQSAGGKGSGRSASGDGAGPATGVAPAQPDPRIALSPRAIIRVPLTKTEAVDSIVSVVIGIYNDSMEVAAARRKPGDWTVKGRDGETWGWDEKGIRLGKFTIPQALLALLPLNVSGPSPIDVRNRTMIRREIMENAQRSISEDEFRDAVKRIRERKEREKRDNLLASDGNTPPVQP